MRSALAEVLAVTVGVRSRAPIEAIDRDGVRLTLIVSGASPRAYVDAPWLHDSPAEAIEALHARGLYLWSPGEGPRWWCSVCDGSGVLSYFTEIGPEGDACDTCAEDDMEATGGYRTTGHLADPPSLAALVAVASLGAPTLLRVAELAAEIARHAGCAGARLVWRVMSREAIEAQRRGLVWGVAPSTIVEAFIHGAWEASDQRPGIAANAWGKWRTEVVLREINDAMPMLSDLHALGVHLVALDAQRIVLAVEAIGGDR